MSKRRRSDPKEEALKGYGCLNPKPNDVKDELFLSKDFFDPRDLLQVKYEMLRRVRVDRWSVTHASDAFGFARSSFYEAHTAYEKEGVAGLLPQRRGPQGAHKLSDEVMEFIEELRSKEGALNAKQLAAAVKERFALTVHPRSIERALSKKNQSEQSDERRSTTTESRGRRRLRGVARSGSKWRPRSETGLVCLGQTWHGSLDGVGRVRTSSEDQ